MFNLYFHLKKIFSETILVNYESFLPCYTTKLFYFSCFRLYMRSKWQKEEANIKKNKKEPNLDYLKRFVYVLKEHIKALVVSLTGKRSR